MNDDNVNAKIIAEIISRIKAASGIRIDEEKLTGVLSASLYEIREKNQDKYLEIIEELSDKLEEMAEEIGKLQKTQ